MPDPSERFKINLNQNLLGLIVGLEPWEWWNITTCVGWVGSGCLSRVDNSLPSGYDNCLHDQLLPGEMT